MRELQVGTEGAFRSWRQPAWYQDEHEGDEGGVCEMESEAESDEEEENDDDTDMDNFIVDSDDEEEAGSEVDRSSEDHDTDHRDFRDQAAAEMDEINEVIVGKDNGKGGNGARVSGLKDVRIETDKSVDETTLADHQWDSDETESSAADEIEIILEESDDDAREDAVYAQSPFEATMHDYQSNMAYEGLVKVYIVADKLQDLAMTNSVMDTIMHVGFHFGLNPKAAPVHLAYASTAPGSPLRAYLRDCWIHETDDAAEDLRQGGFPFQFGLDFAVEIMHIKATSDHNKLSNALSVNLRKRVQKHPCYYHQHDDSCASAACKRVYWTFLF